LWTKTTACFYVPLAMILDRDDVINKSLMLIVYRFTPFSLLIFTRHCCCLASFLYIPLALKSITFFFDSYKNV
jgi:hypothetical protein